MAEGFNESEKPLPPVPAEAALRANANSTLCANAPDVPCRVSVEDPGWASAAALSVIVCAAPGVNVRVEGEAVTPAGRPASVAETWPVNPSNAATETLNCVVCPTESASDGLFPAKAKSG
jgi:hypothetical protein